ncbi:MAG: imidazole glycerol phosphate synthase subunit HisH [Verrucomicrobiota bacterium]|nr:imidazole glycerol phosphate synthase subunit HisH [Verrucomicrobiota bacterium]
MIALIDYGSGNVRSVFNALQHESAPVELISSPDRLSDARALVVPGVGAFGDCARGLEERGFWAPVKNWLDSDKPFLGICVGYQLLFEASEESEGVRGFGYFAGLVKRFRTPGFKVPQIGWNQLDLTQPRHPLWRALPANPHVYFVHSYFPAPVDDLAVTAHATYGETFAASAARGRVAGVQFHPEKSQAIGLGILRNFIQSVN